MQTPGSTCERVAFASQCYPQLWMPAKILDGKAIRDQILSELKPRIDRLPRRPGLAVVLVGHDPASEVYVRNKVKASETLGIYSEKLTPDTGISTEDLLAIV